VAALIDIKRRLASQTGNPARSAARPRHPASQQTAVLVIVPRFADLRDPEVLVAGALHGMRT